MTESMSFAADFHVRTYLTPGKARESMQKEAVCGGKQSGLFAWYDPDSSLWRTWQRCLTGGLMKFLGRWPKAGMMLNGKSYQQPCLEHRTLDNDVSYLPTPVAYDAEPWGPNNHYQGIGQMAKKGLLPTPRSSDGNGPGKHGSGGPDLRTAILYPTPCSRDYRSPNANGNFEDQLPNAIGGKLHPLFVEWMMGYPAGWTDLEHSETQ